MNGLLLLVPLQALNGLDVVQPLGTQNKFILKDLSWIIGGGIVLAVVLMIWAVRYVRTGRRRRHRSKPLILQNSREAEEESAGGERRSHRRRRRRRRSHQEHRSRNPSLAETGGLPPVRSDDSSAPPAA